MTVPGSPLQISLFLAFSHRSEYRDPFAVCKQGAGLGAGGAEPAQAQERRPQGPEITKRGRDRTGKDRTGRDRHRRRSRRWMRGSSTSRRSGAGPGAGGVEDCDPEGADGEEDEPGGAREADQRADAGNEISSRTGSTNRRASNTRTSINDASSNQILHRRRQIPPRLRSEHLGEGRLAASHQQLQTSLWRVETPSLSEEIISEKLKMDDGCSKSEEETCVICLDAIQMNHEEMSTTLCCGHVYHVRCIKTWLMVKNECALCRASVIHINGR